MPAGRGCDALSGLSAANGRRIAVHSFGGMDDAVAWIAGRMAQAAFGPAIKIGNRIDDAPAELAIDRPSAIAAMLFERPGGKAEMHSGVGRPQISGNNGYRSGIHSMAPLGFERSGGLPLGTASNGADAQARGSDRLRGVKIVTPHDKQAANYRRFSCAGEVAGSPRRPNGALQRSAGAYVGAPQTLSTRHRQADCAP